jgi:hypothetical protein
MTSDKLSKDFSVSSRVARTGDLDESRVGEWGPHCFTLTTVDAVVAEGVAVEAVGGPAGPAVRTAAIAEREWRHHEVALLDVSNVGADVFDDADVLMADWTKRVR